jgi:L-asparaginase II
LDSTIQSACKRVVDSILDHPDLVAGTRNRVDTDIMKVCQHSIIAKVGAEGVYAMGVLPNKKYPNGLGIAIKIEDGNDRATAPAAVETLDQIGLLSATEQGQLSSWKVRSIKNHGGTFVGELRPVFELGFHP